MGIECIVIVYGDIFSLAAKNHMHNIFSAFIAMYTEADDDDDDDDDDTEAELLGLQFNPVKDVGHLVHLTRLEALGLKVDGVTSELHSGA